MHQQSHPVTVRAWTSSCAVLKIRCETTAGKPLPFVEVAISEAFGKRIRGNLQLSDPVILVGGHGHEFGLWYDEGPVSRLGSPTAYSLVVPVPRHVQDVHARLVAVHGVEDDVSVVVQLVVRQLDLVEGDDLLHPVTACSRRVRVNVDARRRDGIGSSGRDPRRAARAKASTACQQAEQSEGAQRNCG